MSYIHHAQYLGHDAALAAASWVIMTDSDAESVLDDIDPGVLDQWQEPNLSGEWADDPTLDSLAEEVFGPDHTAPDIIVHDVADAWETAASDAFQRAIQGVALRTLGRIEEALEVERELDQEAEVLKRKAGL